MRNKLREQRFLKKMTQQELADKVGIERSYYSNIELGRYTPSLKNAIKIKEALDYYKDDIFTIKK